MISRPPFCDADKRTQMLEAHKASVGMARLGECNVPYGDESAMNPSPAMQVLVMPNPALNDACLSGLT